MSKPDALALADQLETATANVDLAGLVRIEISSYVLDQAADELRRLHAENEALKEALLEMRHRVTELCQSYGNPLPLSTFEKADAAMKEANHG